MVSAHLLALAQTPGIGFANLVVSATTPVTRDDLAGLVDGCADTGIVPAGGAG